MRHIRQPETIPTTLFRLPQLNRQPENEFTNFVSGVYTTRNIMETEHINQADRSERSA